jgi:hypothetical protein
MKINPDRKMYMGVGKFMLPIPLVISNKGLQKGVSGAKAKAGLLSEEEQKVHHFVVKKMADVQEPITAEFISEELGISLKTVVKIIEKLEVLKTFLYRTFVYGRLQNKDLTFTINTKCANSGKEIQIDLDSEMNITSMTEGAEPMYSTALINTDKMKEKSIVDVF